LRHKIFGQGPFLPPEHPARKTRRLFSRQPDTASSEEVAAS
jgi:hypothetical protein